MEACAAATFNKLLPQRRRSVTRGVYDGAGRVMVGGAVGRDFLGRIRWTGTLAGIAAGAPLALLFTFFVFSAVDSRLYRIFIAEGTGTTAREQALFDALSAASHLVAALPAFFLGGLLAGRIAAAFPGSNGATSAGVGAAAIFACVVGPLVPWIWEPISNPGEVYTRAENLNNLMVFGVGFCVVLPFVVLSGYLGGLLGGRIRGRSAAEETAF